MTDDTRSSSPALGLVAAPPPAAQLTPQQLESYVRSAMHQDRRPGNVLVVRHPLRMYKVPRGLLGGLKQAGFHVEVVDTHPDRVLSVRRIRDTLLELGAEDKPLDIVVIAGDGSLDHHVLVAAFWAFYPDMVVERQGEVVCDPTEEDLAALHPAYREAFCSPVPDGDAIEATQDVITELWQIRDRLVGALRNKRSVGRIVRRSGRDASDPMLRVAVLAALLPHRVTLRAHGFDLAGLAKATKERTFQGLYPFVRSIAAYPAGTAADNAVFAGVPGWGYAQLAGWLAKIGPLEGWRTRWEAGLTARFLEFFTQRSVVVPARFSVVAFDGSWQVISSHAAGGPAAGHFFSADLGRKTAGMVGYLARIPRVVIQEGLFGSTEVRITTRDAAGAVTAQYAEQMAEGLYTNRTFIAGVGSVPSTNPTSFAGQSSLMIVPPIVGRNKLGRRQLNLRGIGAFAESILKGVLARVMHQVGLGVGRMAGGGKLSLARPEHQLTIKEGEELAMTYLWHNDKAPRFVPTQVSGDPFQAWSTAVRVAWGPLPLLAHEDSLLLGAARRSLAHLRVEQTYRLRGVNIGGLYYFRHRTGPEWTPAFTQRTGLVQPPRHLRRSLAHSQRTLIEQWQLLGTGEFVDTSESGLQLGRRGRYAHNNDHTAHLVVLKERRGTLLVRQVRSDASGEIYESRAWYRAFGPAFIIHRSETRRWRHGDVPTIEQEEHFFRSAEAFQQEAPTFFPFGTGMTAPTGREDGS